MVYPNAVSVSFVKFEQLDPMKTEDFAIQLLREKGVLIIPGNRLTYRVTARMDIVGEKTLVKVCNSYLNFERI
ncbi:hypothetical protein ICE98_03710 [Lactococcus lactis]|nr:hypothetical protein [Lactococcus lactis]